MATPITSSVLERADALHYLGREILMRTCLGQEIPQVQKEMKLSKRQVDGNLATARDAIGATNRTNAAAWGPILKIVSPEAILASLTTDHPGELTDKRLRFVQILVSGASNPGIAGELGINVTSVSKPITIIHKPLGTHNRYHLASAAVVLGLVPLSAVSVDLPDRRWAETDGLIGTGSAPAHATA